MELLRIKGCTYLSRSTFQRSFYDICTRKSWFRRNRSRHSNKAYSYIRRCLWKEIKKTLLNSQIQISLDGLKQTRQNNSNKKGKIKTMCIDAFVNNAYLSHSFLQWIQVYTNIWRSLFYPDKFRRSSTELGHTHWYLRWKRFKYPINKIALLKNRNWNIRQRSKIIKNLYTNKNEVTNWLTVFTILSIESRRASALVAGNTILTCSSIFTRFLFTLVDI